MDWEMPEMTGPEVVKAFRSRGMHTPILMLTGKGTLDDKETGFGAGADDYLTKPFALKELILRIDALLRRPPQVISAILQAGELSLDSKARVLKVGERTVHLEPMEFSLLELFVKYPNEAFTYDALLNRVWSSDSDASEDTVRTCVKKLRRKISEDPNNSPIETVHRVGYRFRL
jgi:DNA-binding response OmpR family regulator